MCPQPAISVLMPVFNAADTVSEAIESILYQTESDYEYIIVDDGSTDTTPELIEQWAQKDSRIRFYVREHKGIVSALNFALKQTCGSYVARMDADDLAYPHRLERQHQFLNTHPDVGLVSCLVEHMGDKQEKAGYARYVKWVNSLVSHEAISLNRFIESPLAHPSVMFRKRVADTLGGYRQGNFPEDYELWLRWLEQGIQMEKVPEVLLQWRDEHDRLSRSHERYSFDAFYAIKAIYLARWLRRNNPYYPDIVVWGAGRTSRRRSELLTRYGIRITHYIDVDPNKVGQVINERPVWNYNDIPQSGRHFIVSYVGHRGANTKINKHLVSLGYREGYDYIFAA